MGCSPYCRLGIAVVIHISKSAPALNLQVNTTGNSCNFLFTWPLKRACLNWKFFNRNKPNPRRGSPPPFYFIFFPNEATSLISLGRWFSQGHLTRTGFSHGQIKAMYSNCSFFFFLFSRYIAAHIFILQRAHIFLLFPKMCLFSTKKKKKYFFLRKIAFSRLFFLANLS